MKLKNKFIPFHFFIVAMLFSISSCKKYVEIDPPKTQIISSEVFTSDATAIAASGSMYSRLVSNGVSFTEAYPTSYAGQSSDEFRNFANTAGTIEFYQNSLTSLIGNISSMWNNAYFQIYGANANIEGLEASSAVSPAIKNQLTGEAKFIRAYLHFYLVNMFGDVPYITTTDYRANSLVSRTPKAEVYQKLLEDLRSAESLLPDNFSHALNGERVRVNKSAAAALLARVHLYMGDWANAEAKATAVINKSTVYSLVPNLNNVFLKNSTETIWQLWQNGLNNWNTLDGRFFIPTTTTPPAFEVTLSNQLLAAFETGDNRKTSWVGTMTISGTTYNYPNKYKIRTGTVVTEYNMMLRLAEQYLIRAEARAQQNNLSGAIADLNVIRLRAGLPALSGSLTQAQVIAAVKKERRIELFAELGHRWFDLKRWNEADAVLGPIKPGWTSTDALYPIPNAQILNDPNMTQNPGY